MSSVNRLDLQRRTREYATSVFWSGAANLSLRVPWFTPDAIRFFDHNRIWEFMRTARVLELGAGGSTLFFGDFCASVASLETNAEWIGKVHQLAPKNVTLFHVSDIGAVREALFLFKEKFDIAIVDGDPAAYGRGDAAGLILPMMNPKAMFITDNYYLEGSMVKAFQVPSDWDHNDFNDKHWHGCGTRISTRGF